MQIPAHSYICIGEDAVEAHKATGFDKGLDVVVQLEPVPKCSAPGLNGELGGCGGEVYIDQCVDLATDLTVLTWMQWDGRRTMTEGCTA